MRIPVTKPLFAWDCLEDGPSLTTVREFLAIVPDAKLLHALHQWRGRGRNDYSVAVLWRVLLLTILLRHVTIAACLDELRRNAGLRRAIGIQSEEEVPNKWNMSRFHEVLGQGPHLSLLREVFNTLARRLGLAVSDLGVDTAGDATGLSARRDHKKNSHPDGVENALGLETEGDGSGRLDRSKPKPPSDSQEALPQPTGGRKEYTDAEGNVTPA